MYSDISTAYAGLMLFLSVTMVTLSFLLFNTNCVHNNTFSLIIWNCKNNEFVQLFMPYLFKILWFFDVFFLYYVYVTYKLSITIIDISWADFSVSACSSFQG